MLKTEMNENNEPTNETEVTNENKILKTDDDIDDNVTVKSLGVCAELCEACEQLKWKKPTFIQREALPVALQGNIYSI